MTAEIRVNQIKSRSGINTLDFTGNGFSFLTNVGFGTTNSTSLVTIEGDALATGIITASSFSGNVSGTAVTATTANITNLTGTLSGVSTNFVSAIGIQSAGTVIGAGITQLNFIGTGNTFAVNGTTVDISISGGGGGGGGDGSQFNTGITTTVVATATGIGTTVLTLPATADTQYLVYSIFASNVATGNTEVNFIGAFDFTSGYAGGQRSYFAYNIPIPTGTSIELLEQPQILNPSDRITIRSTDSSRNGADDIVKVFITYEEKTSTDYFGIGISTVGLAVTTPVGIYTSSTNPSIVQSIRLVNRTDTGSYPITVDITSGVTTTKLVDNLIVPKYGSVELLAQPKRILANDVIKVQVDQASTIDVQVSGKQIN